MARIETMSDDLSGMRKKGSIHVDKTQVIDELISSTQRWRSLSFRTSRPSSCASSPVI